VKEKLIEELEEIAANSWPADVYQQLGRWRLRSFDGITKRANSVFTINSIPCYEHWMDEIAAFYERQSLPVRFHISEASPPELDSYLEDLGYSIEEIISVQIASCQSILNCSNEQNAYRMILNHQLDPQWLDFFMQIEKFSDQQREFYQKILSKIGPKKCFVYACDEEKPVGVGTVVLERGWAGLMNIATAKEFRRQGVATQIISALTEWSECNGAKNMYLHVVKDNINAMNLYHKLGFAHVYDYHFRAKQQK
jgi:GNAT superfamily N-acetyltransferase